MNVRSDNIAKLYKTLTVKLKCSSKDYEYLLNARKLAAEAWNKIVDLDHEYCKKNNRKWLTQSQLQKLTKKCVNLHAKGIHFVLFKYLHARDSALSAKKGNGENNRYPYKKKKYFNVGWDYQCVKVDKINSKLILSKPKEIINGKSIMQKPLHIKVKNIPENIVEVEVLFKDKLYLAIKYKEEVETLQIKSDNHASIDLGEIHAITSIDSSSNAIIITGRKIRAIKQLRNKNQAKIYKRLSRCTKGSRQYWKYMNALKKLRFKTESKINDATHKISKLYLDYCIENNVSTVYYGDLDSATRSTKENKKGNRKVRQKLSQWNYGKLVKQLENKLSRYGIKMVKVKEYYTSSKCPNCKELNKPTKRNYTCSCGYEQHRDIVGAINILNDNYNTSLKYYENKKYLRIA